MRVTKCKLRVLKVKAPKSPAPPPPSSPSHQVGSQVSGSIKTLYADFNSTVRQGQVIAELDPLLEA